MWSSWSEQARASLNSAVENAEKALERTGDALSKAATNAARGARHQDDVDAAPASTTTGRYAEDAPSPSEKQKEILRNLQAGWSSVVSTTKEKVKEAQSKLEEEQHRFQKSLAKARSAFYRRDPSLPLDVPALKDAEVVYLTDRLITMSHPAMASTTDLDISSERKLAAVGHLLQRRHAGRFMVWNLSEVEYDIDILDDQVMTFSFPGSPSPPLGLLLKLLVSMESWLKADPRNVAVVHCLTGKGRTSTVLAAFLCWMNEAGFGDMNDALAYIARCKQLTPDELTIPSQRRYASYFKNMLDSVRPSQPPLNLKRIIMSEAPRFAKGPPLEGDKKDKAEDEATARLGCAPYLQLFKAGKLLKTVPASLHFQQSPDELPFCQVADGTITFNVDEIVQGDILVRCRHLTAGKQRVSMFRAAFHTGYVPPKVMRLTKSQLDGACMDARFPSDFFLDLIFEPVDAEAASQYLQESEPDGPSAVESGESPTAQALAGGATTVKASAYDTMLHRDSRFWDVIAERREAHAVEPGHNDPLVGPTVGRRREFDKKVTSTGPGEEDDKYKAEKAALETFSIGGEFDFLPETVEPEAAPPKKLPQPQRKKDSLMEALMGALDDKEEASDAGIEEIVFGDASEASEDVTPVAENKSEPAPTMVALPPAPSEESADAKPAAAPVSAPAPAAVSEVEDLLADANLGADDDMDALLAGADDDDDIDPDLLEDYDDAELDDLENFLSPGKKE